jgi:hypothetical protein
VHANFHLPLKAVWSQLAYFYRTADSLSCRRRIHYRKNLFSTEHVSSFVLCLWPRRTKAPGRAHGIFGRSDKVRSHARTSFLPGVKTAQPLRLQKGPPILPSGFPTTRIRRHNYCGSFVCVGRFPKSLRGTAAVRTTQRWESAAIDLVGCEFADESLAHTRDTTWSARTRCLKNKTRLGC